MKLRFASDLHLEFTSDITYIDSLIPPMENDKDTVLALLGDIHVGTGVRYYLHEMSQRFKAVIYVLGNHEFYHNNFYDLKYELADMFVDTNVYILENESVTIDGQKFVGCTLWTDVEKQNPNSVLYVGKHLRDYQYIKSTDDKYLTVGETVNAHVDSINYLTNSVDKDTIVLTHHAPILGVSSLEFKSSKIRGGFESDLSDLIYKLQPKYWLYGHTHFGKDVTIDNTILLSNQRCYLHEVDSYNPNMILEV